MDKDPTIGHRHDRTLDEMSEVLFQLTLKGDEPGIRAVQEQMRAQFGDLF
jgi:hypothetical protein